MLLARKEKKHFIPDRFRVWAIFGAVFLLYSFFLRISFFWISRAQIEPSFFSLIKIFGIGFFFDLVTYSYFSLPFFLYLLFLPSRLFTSNWHRVLSLLIFFAGMYGLFFDFAAEWLFWQEFSARFNFIAVDYLVYSQEVLQNIRESYPLGALLGSLFFGAAVLEFLLSKALFWSLSGNASFQERWRFAFVWLMVPLLSYIFVHNSSAEFSQNSFQNEVAKNGLHSLVNAYRDNTIDYEHFYITKNRETMLARVRPMLLQNNGAFISDKNQNLTREIGPSSGVREKHYNVILLSVESLSAKFLATFGNTEKLTPNLDRIATESILFTNLYATGTRTVRGLEALSLALPPTPGSSIIRRPNNNDLFSIGTVFREKGYETKFVYGGFGYFDNMNAYFAANGFTIVDRSNMSKEEIQFANVWGVSDEDLFNRTLKEADDSYNKGKHFFSLVMTTSNHRPYTYPQKVDIRSGSTRQGAVKYTDFAIGEFLDKAKTKSWFKNTIFVIVADHCDSSAGKGTLPILQYHIPFLVYAPGIIKPQKIEKISSQMDVAPTILGLLGFGYRTKFFGVDILNSNQERALIATYQKVGLYKNGVLVALSPGRKLEVFLVDPKTKELSLVNKKDEEKYRELIDDAIAYYQVASIQFKEGALKSHN